MRHHVALGFPISLFHLANNLIGGLVQEFLALTREENAALGALDIVKDGISVKGTLHLLDVVVVVKMDGGLGCGLVVLLVAAALEGDVLHLQCFHLDFGGNILDFGGNTLVFCWPGDCLGG